MTPLCGEEITSTKPRWKRLCVFFVLFVLLCVPPPPAYVVHKPMAQYSLFVLKEPLNTNKPNQTFTSSVFLDFFAHKLVH